MDGLNIVYILIIVVVLLMSGGCYYFYTKFNQLESEVGFVKSSFNEIEEETKNQDKEVSSNFGSDLDNFVSDSESEDEELEQEQLKLAEEFYKSLTQGSTGIVRFEEASNDDCIHEIQEEQEQEQDQDQDQEQDQEPEHCEIEETIEKVKPKRKNSKK